MIELPIWAAVLLVGLLPVVGLGCYWYGWRLRSSLDERVIRVEHVRFGDRPMSTEERHAADEAFEHMDRAFESMRKVFRR